MYGLVVMMSISTRTTNKNIDKITSLNFSPIERLKFAAFGPAQKNSCFENSKCVDQSQTQIFFCQFFFDNWSRKKLFRRVLFKNGSGSNSNIKHPNQSHSKLGHTSKELDLVPAFCVETETIHN